MLVSFLASWGPLNAETNDFLEPVCLEHLTSCDTCWSSFEPLQCGLILSLIKHIFSGVVMSFRIPESRALIGFATILLSEVCDLEGLDLLILDVK